MFPELSALGAFLVASLILAVTPGPGVLYVVTRTLAQGRRAGLASVTGVALGNLGNAVGASLGLATLFEVSSIALVVVQYAGSTYLIYLGLRMLRAPEESVAADPFRPVKVGRLLQDGFVVALFNPKTALFFAAFLPQFLNPSGSALSQCLLLGSIFVSIAASTDTAYVLAASAIGPSFTRAQATQPFGRFLTGGVFIGLGILTAASGVRRPR